MENTRLLMYLSQKQDKSTIWLLFLFLGWSYGSLGKIGIQILYYLTCGGLGVWTLIRLFTLNDAIDGYNFNIAVKLGFTEKEIADLGITKPTSWMYNEVEKMENTKSNGIATASLVCAIIALPLNFIPFMGWAVWILAILAIIFGGVGISSASNKDRAIAGLVLGILNIPLFWIATAMFIAALSV